MKSIYIALLITLGCGTVVALTGCERTPSSVRECLATAEAIMDGHPDSALAMLDTISPAALRTEADRALYALMLTHARYKNYIDETNDSLINIAVAYYDKTGEVSRHSVMARFLQGFILNNREEFGRSIVSLKMAEEEALQLDDQLYLGNIYQIMGDGYGYVCDGPDEILCAQKALQAYRNHGDSVFVISSVVALGKAYNNNYMCDESKALIEPYLKDGFKDVPERYRPDMLRILAKAEYGKHEYEQCLRYCEESVRLYPEEVTEQVLEMACDAYSKLKGATLSPALSAMLDELEAEKGYKPHEFYTVTGDYKRAYESLLIFSKACERMIFKITWMDVANRSNEYQSDKLKRKDTQLRQSRIWSVVVSIAIAAVAALIIWYQKIRMRRHKDQFIAQLDSATRDMSTLESYNDILRKFSFDLYGPQLNVVERLCAEYFDSNSTSASKDRTFSQLKKYLASTDSLDRAVQKLEKEVNAACNGIMRDFRTAVPELPEEDYRVFLLSVIGLQPKTISMIMGQKLVWVYNRKGRIKARINDMPQHQKDIFNRYLHKTETEKR